MYSEWQIADLIALVRERYGGWRGFGDARFVADEIEPKRRTAARARELLGREEVAELLAAWQYEELLARLERVGRDGSLLFNRVPRQGDLAILYAVRERGRQEMGQFALQVQRLLYGQEPTGERLDAFAAYALKNHLPNRWPFPTYFLFMTQPGSELFVKPQAARWFLKYVGQGQLYEATPSGRLYALLRGYAHGLLQALQPLGATDMVDVQSFLWVCARESRGRAGRLEGWGQVEYGRGEWGVVLRESGGEEIRGWETGGGETGDSETGGGEIGEWETGDSGSGAYSLAELAEESGFEEEQLARWVRAVERKGQAIIYGPPGTGKTMLAQGLARHLVGGGDGFVDLVQLHPAYQYEDFVQGLRPTAGEDGEPRYEMKPGHFLSFCREAARREGRCVLIVDEVNRANLSRVFGELLYLLEYREEAAALAGGGELRVPHNVRLIGTMNTADRSIALLDHALRRRFAFIALLPDYGVLRRFHERRGTGFDVERLIQVLQRLNREIGDPHYEVGITFFLREDLEAQLEDVWRMEIEPYLEEVWFDRPELVERWRWGEGGPLTADA